MAESNTNPEYPNPFPWGFTGFLPLTVTIMLITAAGIRTRVTTETILVSIADWKSPLMPIMGSTDISTIGTMMPRPKITIQGVFREEQKVLPDSRRPLRAISEASLSISDLSFWVLLLSADIDNLRAVP